MTQGPRSVAGPIHGIEEGLTVSELSQGTMMFRFTAGEEPAARRILLQVFEALEEKGYNPVTQLVGYLLSGDPTYITSHRDARSIIRRVDRDDLLEELVASYLARGANQPQHPVV